MELSGGRGAQLPPCVIWRPGALYRGLAATPSGLAGEPATSFCHYLPSSCFLGAPAAQEAKVSQ